MKDRLGYFQLHIFNHNESEKHVYQNGRVNDFELNNKVKNGPWVRVYKPTSSTIRWYSDNRVWGEPLNLSSIFTIDETAIRPRRGTSDPLPVSISGDWTWEDPIITDEENTLRVTNINTTARSVTVDRDILRGVRSHQEEMNRLVQQQAEALLHRNEMERRAAQSQADARRREEERTRQRRPWERARNFFGLD